VRITFRPVANGNFNAVVVAVLHEDEAVALVVRVLVPTHPILTTELLVVVFEAFFFRFFFSVLLQVLLRWRCFSVKPPPCGDQAHNSDDT
jgi:hypothetical protein